MHVCQFNPMLPSLQQLTLLLPGACARRLDLIPRYPVRWRYVYVATRRCPRLRPGGMMGLARVHPLTKTQAMEPSRQTRSSDGPPYPLGRWSCSTCSTPRNPTGGHPEGTRRRKNAIYARIYAPKTSRNKVRLNASRTSERRVSGCLGMS